MQDEFLSCEDGEQNARELDAPQKDRDHVARSADLEMDQLAGWFIGERQVRTAAEPEISAETEREVAELEAGEPEAVEPASVPSNDLPESGNDSPYDPPALSLRDFYGLQQEPFGITPDPAYLYASQTHSQALDSLFAGIRENRGFLALVAEPGMGKTSLLFQLLQDLQDSARTVFLFQTQCDSHELLRYILHGLDIDTDGMGLVAMHDKLNEVLFQEMMAGKRFVLVVDEAQNLDDAVLETLRMLSNYEAHHSKLLQIVLAGQPQLAVKLAQPQLLQFRQRISVLAHLEPLSAAEIARYLGHRLAVAGYRGEPLFETEAVALIAQCSHGIPRNINNLCYQALLVAHDRGARAITPEIVREAADRLNIEALIPRRLATPDSAPPNAPLFSSYQPGSRKAGNPGRAFAWPRWPLRAAALATILIVGSSLLFLLERGKQTQASPGDLRPSSRAANSSPVSSSAAYSAEPQNTGKGQVITVVVRPNQSLRDVALVYAGHYDPDLVVEIRALNPGVDLDHLSGGQLLQIPLPPGTLKKAD